ncbi:MAG: DUF1501 domain-containing protein [Planctomycetota bacterium]|nr:DUF1501 domain-containing protein [Planctomycetota bacterium]
MTNDNDSFPTLNRRSLVGCVPAAIGAAAFSSLLGSNASAADDVARNAIGGLTGLPHMPPKAKRVICLFQSGGPSHLDLFDYKPKLRELDGTELPDSIRKGQRLTEMTSSQSTLPCVASRFKFAQHGESGTWLCENFPHLSTVVDEMCVVKSLFTEAVNHDPAITLMNTGTQQLGKPSMGSWVSYGLGSENHNLPSYVVFISQGGGGQPLFSRLWSSGFLPSQYQGVRFRSGQDPVLFLNDPPGIDRTGRRVLLDGLTELNSIRAATVGDPEISTRIAQYEMAFRMQTAVPELMDLSDESEATFELYGPASRTPGTFAANCLLARRLSERGVRFIQLFQRGWDHHGDLPNRVRARCQDTDQPTAALIKDLKSRGLLDDTLIFWGGEFGRTVYAQGKPTPDNYGRDHHGRCYTVFLAGGGIKGGQTYGETDDYGYNITENPVHVNDLNATMLHCLGIDHRKLTFPFQGLAQRLTGVEEAKVVAPLLS